MKKVLCFGEVLWDCLPSGEYPGGAPLNVAYHLARLGLRPVMLSTVGSDDSGHRIMKWMRDAGIQTKRVAYDGKNPTGRVKVMIDDDGRGTFEIEEPAAWDQIFVDDDTVHATTASHALVYGTLACRSEANREALKFLVALWEPLKVLDVNLREPYDDIDVALELGRRSDVIKLNESELFQLTGFTDDDETPRIHDGVKRLSEMTGCASICVTRGAAGALFLHHGRWYSSGAPRVDVKDTVGAGDAFTAALVAFLLAKRPETDFAHGLATCCALGAHVASCDGGQPEYDPLKVLHDVPWLAKGEDDSPPSDVEIETAE